MYTISTLNGGVRGVLGESPGLFFCTLVSRHKALQDKNQHRFRANQQCSNRLSRCCPALLDSHPDTATARCSTNLHDPSLNVSFASCFPTLQQTLWETYWKLLKTLKTVLKTVLKTIGNYLKTVATDIQEYIEYIFEYLLYLQFSWFSILSQQFSNGFQRFSANCHTIRSCAQIL